MLPFYETARADLLEAIDAHEQSVQNVKGSHEALNLSLSLFKSNSRSFYKIQETLVELGRVYHHLSELGVMDMVSAEPQEFKQALVYAEQARARTLGAKEEGFLPRFLLCIYSTCVVGHLPSCSEAANTSSVFVMLCF